MEYVTLTTGAKMPLLGYGTWQAKDETELSAGLRAALDYGYRLIDTAYLYGNEHIIGNVLKEYFDAGKLKREDIFVTTKLPFTAHHPTDVDEVVTHQLKALQLDYVDLYLMHSPCPFKKQIDSFAAQAVDGQMVAEDVPHIDTWREFERLFKEGKLRAIGLSNFNDDQVKDLYEKAEIKPHNLQVEAHIYWPQYELADLCKKLHISFTAYAPIGSPGRKAARPDGNWPEGDPLVEPVVQEIAKKHGKTPAQVLLRHLVQRGISAIPKSVRPDRIRENFDIFDFKLSSEEVHELEAIKTRVRLFVFDFGRGHRYFPHKDLA
ncbi:unnamed protein product, partial [Mesorhabditis spiculigera]